MHQKIQAPRPSHPQIADRTIQGSLLFRNELPSNHSNSFHGSVTNYSTLTRDKSMRYSANTNQQHSQRREINASNQFNGQPQVGQQLRSRMNTQRNPSFEIENWNLLLLSRFPLIEEKERVHFGNLSTLNSQEFLKKLQKIRTNLAFLYSQEDHTFWAYLAYLNSFVHQGNLQNDFNIVQEGTKLRDCLHSCLRFFPLKDDNTLRFKTDFREHEKDLEEFFLASKGYQKLEELFHLVLKTFQRLSSADSAERKHIISNSWYLDMPKLLNLSFLYGKAEPMITKKIIKQTFETDRDLYMGDFELLLENLKMFSSSDREFDGIISMLNSIKVDFSSLSKSKRFKNPEYTFLVRIKDVCSRCLELFATVEAIFKLFANSLKFKFMRQNVVIKNVLVASAKVLFNLRSEKSDWKLTDRIRDVTQKYFAQIVDRLAGMFHYTMANIKGAFRRLLEKNESQLSPESQAEFKVIEQFYFKFLIYLFGLEPAHPDEEHYNLFVAKKLLVRESGKESFHRQSYFYSLELSKYYKIKGVRNKLSELLHNAKKFEKQSREQISKALLNKSNDRKNRMLLMKIPNLSQFRMSEQLKLMRETQSRLRATVSNEKEYEDEPNFEEECEIYFMDLSQERVLGQNTSVMEESEIGKSGFYPDQKAEFERIDNVSTDLTDRNGMFYSKSTVVLGFSDEEIDDNELQFYEKPHRRIFMPKASLGVVADSMVEEEVNYFNKIKGQSILDLSHIPHQESQADDSMRISQFGLSFDMIDLTEDASRHSHFYTPQGDQVSYMQSYEYSGLDIVE